jgi:hypothetical protein
VRRVIFVTTLALAGAAGLCYWNVTSSVPELPVHSSAKVIEPAPLCPWRNPEADLQRFFPGASDWRTETRILSGRRLELQQLLGRWPAADENSLRIYRVLKDGAVVGSILTRRVKGEHGAIELLLALDTNNVVTGLALQRMREPEEITQALLNPNWLGAFAGKTAAADWQLGRAVPELPGPAAPSGRSIVEGVRSLLILNQLAARDGVLHQHG